MDIIDTNIIKGRRYMVFDADYYNTGGGFHDCLLITDDFLEADAKARATIEGRYSSTNSQVYDVEERVLRTYYDSGVVELAKLQVNERKAIN